MGVVLMLAVVFAVYVVVGAVLVGVLYSGLERSPAFGVIYGGMFSLGMVSGSLTVGPSAVSMLGFSRFVFGVVAGWGVVVGIIVMVLCVEPETGYHSRRWYDVELPEVEAVYRRLQNWRTALTEKVQTVYTAVKKKLEE